MWRDRRAWRPTYRRLTHKCCTSSPHHAKHTHPLSTELSQNTPTLSLHQIWIPSSSPPSNQFVVTARPRVSISKRNPKDQLLEPFLGLADSTSTLSLDLSFNRLLESRPCDLDQNDMIERAMRLGYVLLEAGKRSARKRATMHNAIVWALPPDLTTKVG